MKYQIKIGSIKNPKKFSDKKSAIKYAKEQYIDGQKISIIPFIDCTCNKIRKCNARQAFGSIPIAIFHCPEHGNLFTDKCLITP